AGTVNLHLTRFIHDLIARRLSDLTAASGQTASPANLDPWYTAQESADSPASAYAAPNNTWEGIGEGWFYSTLGGGATLRPTNAASVDLTYDNTNYDDPGHPKRAMTPSA